jgi:uncharacterized protein YabE (DUF348 family)
MVNRRNETLTSNVDGNKESLRSSASVPSLVVVTEGLQFEDEEIVQPAVEDHVSEELAVEAGEDDAIFHLLEQG